VALAAGCGTTSSLRDVDRLSRSTGSRTIVLEPGYSLYSPYSMVSTLGYRNVLDHEVALILGLFELELQSPVPVFLKPVEGMRPRISIENDVFHVEAVSKHPLHGVEGVTGRGVIVVYVEPPFESTAPDGRKLEGTWSPDEYRGTLRHELVHYCASLAGLEGDLWFDEGLAHAVELGATHRGERPEVQTHAGTRRAAGRVPAADRRLARVLAAGEDVLRIREGLEAVDPHARLLASAFVYFALEQGEGSFLERVQRLHRLSHEELLALEPAWQAWLGPEPVDAGKP
jgi:hypothetical protein